MRKLTFGQRRHGLFEGLLKRRGRWVQDFQPPGAGAAAYLDGLGFLGAPDPLGPRDPAYCGGLQPPGRNQAWLVLCPGPTATPAPEYRRCRTLLRPGEPVSGHRLLGGRLGPELLRGMLGSTGTFPPARGSLAAPGDLERRPGLGPGGQGIRRLFGTRQAGRFRGSFPFKAAGVSGVNYLRPGQPGSGAGWGDSLGK